MKNVTARRAYIGNPAPTRTRACAEADHRERHSGDAVLAAGPVGEGRVLDEVGHLAEGQGDHGEVDSDPPHREPADEEAEQA